MTRGRGSFIFAALLLMGCDDLSQSADNIGSVAHSQNDCVSLSSLYSAPLDYDSKDICTTGYFYLSYPHMYLVPDMTTSEDLFSFGIIAQNDTGTTSDRSFGHGDYVSVFGEFDVDEDCYRNHVLGLPNDDGTTTFCGAGSDVLMYFRIVEIDRGNPELRAE